MRIGFTVLVLGSLLVGGSVALYAAFTLPGSSSVLAGVAGVLHGAALLGVIIACGGAE